MTRKKKENVKAMRKKRKKTEQVHRLNHDTKRQSSVGCVTVGKRQLGGGEDGLWQLGASTSR